MTCVHLPLNVNIWVHFVQGSLASRDRPKIITSPGEGLVGKLVVMWTGSGVEGDVEGR